MKKIINIFTMHPSFTSGLWMVLGVNIANFIAYLYHLVFGRLLGPSGYSDFANFISIIVLIQSLFIFINAPIIHFATSKNKDDKRQINEVIRKFNFFVLFLLGVGFLTSSLWAKSFSLSPVLAYLIFPNVFLLYLVVVNGAFLQSQMKFKEYSISLNIGWFLRLFAGILVFYLGFGIYGIFGVYLVASLLTLILIKKSIDKVSIQKIKKDYLIKFVKYSLPVFFVYFAFATFITVDIILVKKFFDANEAGLYASLSALGKIIFYGSYPVTAAIFPMVSKRSHKNERTSKFFGIGALLVLGISGTILLAYKLFPALIVETMFGSSYMEASKYLFLFGIFSTLYSLNYMYANYFMSKNLVIPSIFSFMGSIIQVLGILIFHSSLYEVIRISIFASLIQLASYIIYTVVRVNNVNHGLSVVGISKYLGK